MTTAEITIFFVVAVVVVLIVEHSRRKRLLPYLGRSCSGKSWRDEFPKASNDEIRIFLGLFCDAFLFSAKRRLNFYPGDRIMDIYSAIYPGKLMADALEWEHLRDSLQAKYGRDFSSDFSPDLTLGQLFRKVSGD